MAPKKAKKTADSINSRLALVMKSGKGKDTKLPSKLTNTGLHPDICCSHPRLQVYSEDPPIRQGQARHHRWQHPSSPQVRIGVLCHVRGMLYRQGVSKLTKILRLAKTNVHHFAGNNVSDLYTGPAMKPGGFGGM